MGHQAAVIYTIVENCKRHGVPVEAYLRDLLTRHPTTAVDEAIAAFEECIRLGSDYSTHFITLAQLYLEKNQTHKLSDLKEKAASLESLNRSIILKKLASF